MSHPFIHGQQVSLINALHDLHLIDFYTVLDPHIMYEGLKMIVNLIQSSLVIWIDPRNSYKLITRQITLLPPDLILHTHPNHCHLSPLTMEAL